MKLPESAEPEAFKAFEHERWQSNARVYHDEFGRLTSQVVAPLLDAAGVRSGIRALDIASGPGYIAAAAAARGAQVTGADFSSVMVALASANHPGVEFRVADAEALPFADGSFDAATMGFLIGHLPSPARAVGEAARVLRPGGRFALSWWQPPAKAVPFAIISESIRAHGRTDVGLPTAPPFELFGEAAILRELVSQAGFTGVEVREVPMVWTVGSGAEMFDAYLKGTARTSGLLRGQTPEAQAAIRAEVIERCRPWVKDGRLDLPMPAHVASGVKP